MDGIFNVLKPPGMTSQDVVACLRRALSTKKIGHGGTLDPDAAGVLPVFAGTATRLLEYALEGDKEYIAQFTLGQQTDTGDDSGKVIAEAKVPENLPELVQETLPKFLGKQLQVPPMYSALKIQGKKLYELARQGIEVERQAREIEITKLELLEAGQKSFTVRIGCSKGTYIRVLGEDICKALGSCGTMTFLLRSRVGGFKVEEAKTIQEISENPLDCCSTPLAAVENLPQLTLTGKQADRITNGVRTTVQGVVPGLYVLLSPEGAFLGLGRAEDSMIKAEKILQRYVFVEEKDGNN